MMETQQASQRVSTQERKNRTRLVVGLISSPDEGLAALAKLDNLNLGPVWAIVQARPSTDRDPGSDKRNDLTVRTGWVICRPTSGTAGWIIDPADAGEEAVTRSNSVRELLSLNHWALRRQIDRLSRHLKAGGALLVVEPTSDATERTASTAMLRYAMGGVQTHDLPQSGGAAAE